MQAACAAAAVIPLQHGTGTGEQLSPVRIHLLLGTHMHEIALASITLYSKATMLNTCRLRMKLLRHELKSVHLGIGAPSNRSICLHGNPQKHKCIMLRA